MHTLFNENPPAVDNASHERLWPVHLQVFFIGFRSHLFIVFLLLVFPKDHAPRAGMNEAKFDALELTDLAA